MEKNKAAIRHAIRKVQREPGDTGSPEAQSKRQMRIILRQDFWGCIVYPAYPFYQSQLSIKGSYIWPSIS